MSDRRPIPDALLERYLAGDLDAARAAEIEARIAASPIEKARVEGLRADSAAFLIQHPPGPTVAKHEASATSRPRWLTFVMPVFAAVAALLVAFVVSRRLGPEDDLSVKGSVAFAVFRQSESGTGELLPQGATVKPGDRLRFEVRAPKDGWVAVLSKDGAGHVTVYYPYDGTAAARYQASDSMLPGAIGLDETRGPESAWVLYSVRPFTLGEFVQTLQKGDMLVGSDDVTVSRSDWLKQ